jgi:FkbH-like protein
MTIRVSATSFLLPGNRNWSSLAALDKLDFGEYGDWFSALGSNEADPILCMLFLEDLVPVVSASTEAMDELLSSLLIPLDMRLAKSKAATILAFSGWRQESSISNARSMSTWLQLTRRFEAMLYEIAARHPGLHILNMDQVWSRDGMAAAFDSRNLYAARCRLSSRGIERLSTSAVAIFTRLQQAAKKVLVLDCDNTIWGGVVGEVGVEGIVLGGDGVGKAFAHFQKVAQSLAREGILLALCSKNNEEEVWSVFEQHAGMMLKREDIVAFRINWEEKAENVRSIAQELDLGLSSFVFWDDNPLEREKMRTLCPEVTTPEVPVDVGQWPVLLRAEDMFARFEITREDQKKGAQYRSRAAFINERKSVTDEQDFLKTIGMQPNTLPINGGSLGRAEQLCAKTNQFNLRTVRHSASDIAQLAADNPATSFMVELSDRFGDHGIIALAIARNLDGVAFLDTLLMSCRVLGRHLEAWILAQLVATFKAGQTKWMLAEFIPSGRNVVAENVLSAHGFTVLTPANDPSDGMLSRLAAAHHLQGIVYFIDVELFSIPYQDVFNQS